MRSNSLYRSSLCPSRFSPAHSRLLGSSPAHSFIPPPWQVHHLPPPLSRMGPSVPVLDLHRKGQDLQAVLPGPGPPLPLSGPSELWPVFLVLVQVLVLIGALPGRGARAWAQLWAPEAELLEDRFCSICSRVSVGQVHSISLSQVTGLTALSAVSQQPAGGTRSPTGPDPGVPGSKAGGPESQPQPAARLRTRLVLWVMQSRPGCSTNPGLLLQTYTVPGKSVAPPPLSSPLLCCKASPSCHSAKAL